MSRQFNPSGGSTTDVVNFSLGNAPPDQGPITIGVLAKMDAATGDFWMIQGSAGATAVWGMLAVSNSGERLYMENDFDATGASGLTGGAWRWYVVTKAAGSNKPRWHVWDLSGAWTHVDGGTNVGDGSGPITQLRVGNNANLNRNWRGLIAVDAAWASVLNDAAVEAAFTLNASATLAAGPAFMHRWNQASTATSVTDDTGGGANQSSITGTAVSADDPVGYNYNLSTSVDASGDITATAGRTGAATVEPGGQGTATASAAIAGAATVTANATGTMSVSAAITGTTDQAVTPTAPATNGWGGLLSIYQQNVAEVRNTLTQPITECPNHRYPLEQSAAHPGVLHCVFGGEVFDIHGNPAFVS